ncbi:MAG: glycine--tRNA ligase subunit beta, partial [Gammaproteobacteria bacterium]|nr:glycine--tRNA ligase subunit beta [Gammaproteobacteria bacterium]
DAAGVSHGRVRRFATPRRLAVLIERCAERQPDRVVERRGPPRSAAFDPQGRPTQAAIAFAKSCGVDPAQLCEIASEKGVWVGYRGVESGAATTSLLGGMASRAVAALPLPKRMRWGAGDTEFVRPVHSVVLLFGTQVVPCQVLGLEAGAETRGHRFHAPRVIRLRGARSYAGALRRAKVIADFEERREIVRSGVEAAARACGGRALIDAELLDEVTALVEWPVPVAGRFDERFLALPREVIVATVQDHQRYFPVERDDGTLSGAFVTVSNLASRNPDTVREGNERVVRPRLSDAAFFWEQDRKLPLSAYAERLGEVTFQGRLGSYADKTARVRALALRIGELIGAGEEAVARAAGLAKADLLSAMVGEFPELQGTMGRYYASASGEAEAVAAAIEEQYRPRFAGDLLPTTRVGIALALADRLDTLAGIFAIEQRPTGAKDPFGLRRASLGVLRILLETPLDLDLGALIAAAAAAQPVARAATAEEVRTFVEERLRGLLLERVAGASAEMIEAVFATAPRSPVDAEARLLALRGFLREPRAAVLAAANKRIGNLLKKTPTDALPAVSAERFTEDSERALYAQAGRVGPLLDAALAARDYGRALELGLEFAAPLDDFFAAVMVMDENLDRRHNRLALLRDLQALLGSVADLSRLPS